MKALPCTSLPVLLLFASLGIFQVQEAIAETPQIDTSVTFFYYRDMQEAERFYGEIIGLPKVLDEGWVKMYSIPGGGMVGLVDEAHSTPGLADEKPVMLSIVTRDIESWYARIQERGQKYIKKELQTGEDVGILINAFLLTDPGGYLVEIFKWKKGKGLAATGSGEHDTRLSWRGSSETEKKFFTLGMMNAYAEAVRNKAKILGLGEPLTAGETDALYEYAEAIAKHNKVEIYREPDLLVSDLFPAKVAVNRDVILIYTGDTLDRYMMIKADKQALVSEGNYRGEERKNIARRFGKLLSYKEDVIEEKIRANSRGE